MKTPIKVLYLEDSELDQRAFLRLVREKALPYEMTIAGTLAEAHVHLARTRFDVIVADYHLADGEVTELFDEVREIPFILLTGTLEENLAIRTLARGTDDYLIKDVDRRYLDAVPFTVEKTLYRVHIHETAQRLARELRESEQRLALALSGTRMGMCYRDMATGEIRCTEQFSRLMGLRTTTTTTTTTTLSQVYHYQDWAERVHPEDLPQVEAQQRRCLSEHVPYEAEYRVLWPDTNVRWVVERGVFQYDPDGRPTHLLGVFLDITDRKQAEEALQERMKELACLYAVSRDVQEGLSVDELCRRTVEHLVPAMRFPQSAVAVIELNGRRFTSENYTQGLSHGLHAPIRVDGKVLGRLRVYYAQGRTFLIPEEQNMVDAVAEALSTWLVRQHAEEALRELNAALENKVAERTAELKHRARQLQKLTLDMSETEDRERKRMAAILHDDLQQQIAGAKFHLGLLRNRAKYDASLQALGAQIDQMLKDAIEKSRSLSHELSPTVLHHADFAETLRWLAGEVKAKHGLTVHVHARDKIHSQSDALKGFLYKAAQELLFNIVKHAGVKEAEIRVRQCHRYICLSISDRGRGFDPQALREATGYGLLSIREQIDLLGGRMKIKSAKGKGSTFRIVVPEGEIAGTNSKGETRPNGRTKAAEADKDRLRVLLADDHEIVREGLRSLLSDEHDVEIVGEAANGREAVDLANQLQPDVIVMDMSMPVIEGDEATRQIKAYLPDTRVIAISMYDQAEKIEAMYQAGAESYVLKTAPSEELLAAIRGQAHAAVE